MDNHEITRKAIRSAHERRMNGSTLQKMMSDGGRPDDEPGVLWRGQLALAGPDASEFGAAIRVGGNGFVVLRSSEHGEEEVQVEAIRPEYWEKAITAAVA